MHIVLFACVVLKIIIRLDFIPLPRPDPAIRVNRETKTRGTNII